MPLARAYAALLRLYPASHRALFSSEMQAAFDAVLQQQSGRGRAAVARFTAEELIGLLRGAASAWMAAGRAGPAVNLTRMRPPGVSHETYGAALDEVLAAQRFVDNNLARMQHALSTRSYVLARFYSQEDWKARAHLRDVRRKYGIAG